MSKEPWKEKYSISERNSSGESEIIAQLKERFHIK
jgi:hypothetical protein